MSASSRSNLRILQCLRAPVGGLFRHVCDLVRAQESAGHQVGLVCDVSTGGETASEALELLKKHCALGIHRLVMPRQIGVNDWTAVRTVGEMARDLKIDVLHGHGAKGGAYVRLANCGKRSPLRFYTPHGGSLHYSPYSVQGAIFLTLERILLSRTDGLIFESEYARATYASKVGGTMCQHRVIHNGVEEREFEPITHVKNPANLLFVGELRALKGVATLLEALHQLKARGVTPSAVIVGNGPDEAAFKDLSVELGINAQVSFPGAVPARDAFSLGKTLIVPSHKESFPYIVLEAAAANIPMISTNVGGIPEIFGPYASRLIEPQSVSALAAAIKANLEDCTTAIADAANLQQRVRGSFNTQKMADDVLQFYTDSDHQSDSGGRHFDPATKKQKEQLSAQSG